MSPRGGTRPGAGPKRRLKDGQILSIYVDQPTIDRLDRYCKYRHLSRSEAVRRLVCLSVLTAETKEKDK